MFGKGVYFADMISKSANYCRTSKDSPIGVMLLCEVALGKMYEIYHAKYMDKPPKGLDSTKGVGKFRPNPKENFVTESGLIVPLGTEENVKITSSSLQYNEFIVYDEHQINIKYMLKVKFNYKEGFG
jgi:poly [ADP-ribose] polymerase 1